ncbi:MAG: type II toxin-antitoxin system HipA family toxin YjjJ [Pseudomonadota bacterium]
MGSELITEALKASPATSREIQARTGLSQPTVARYLRELGTSIVKIPNGRSPRYALTRNAFGASDELPLFLVDAYGNNTLAAILRPLASGGFFLEPSTGMPEVLLGEHKAGYFEDLPYFLQDLRPQGFLGRQIAENMSQISDEFPSDPERWSTRQVGRYLVSNGDDLPGNMRFGEQAHLRVRRAPVVSNREEYPRLADGVMRGAIPGSSAGGEQPKFTAYSGDRSAHVIVKFSPKGTDPIASRWRDILITEFHATEALHETEWPAAETNLFDLDGRLFLESVRFDRAGEHGRLSMISLASVDGEFIGHGSGWPKVMRALNDRDLISWQHLFDAEVLWTFGRMINNTDMHLGNLSLAINGNSFLLLPVYDMCSMGFAPVSGEVQPFSFPVPEITNLSVPDAPKIVAGVAFDFWKRVENDHRISDEFREFLRRSNIGEVIFRTFSSAAV